MIKKKYSLVVAAVFDWSIAIAHIVAMFVGATAYDFMDAPELGELARQNSVYPIFLTSLVTVFFILFGFYAISGAGLIRKLPKLNLGLWIIGSIYVIRGLALFVFLVLFLINSPHSQPREIWFSLISLITGICHIYGILGVNIK